MPKNILQDVVPRGGRKSIRDIPLSRPPGRMAEEENGQEEPVSQLRYIQTEEESIAWNEGDSRGRLSRWLIWAIGIVSAGVLAAVLGNFFSGATVSVTPKSQAVSINLSLVAKPNAPAGELSYSRFSSAREAAATVPADGEKTLETRAAGKIAIYNNYSTAPQRLVKNTRFETPDGLIFKIADSVIVPGKHVLAGKTAPGSVEALVYAQSAGEEYNIGLTDFTIPGFKSNKERFANFYGRSKTSMTGGNIGTVKTASDEKMLAARVKLESNLAADLLSEARSRLPQDSVLYDGAYRVSFEPVVSAADVAKDSITFRERANFTAYFIKRGDLARAIAENSVDNFDGSPVLADNDSKLNFILTNKDSLSPASVGPVRFSLKGATTVTWQIDQNKLAASLAGKKKNELTAIAAANPGILKADAVIRPFWASLFPKSADKIKIRVESAN